MSALKEAFKTKSYVLLTAGFFVCGFHITLVGTHVPTYVIDRGLESWTAAAILSLIGLFNIFGSLLSGYLSTKMKKKVILSALYTLRGISICLFIFLTSKSTLMLLYLVQVLVFFGYQLYLLQVGLLLICLEQISWFIIWDSFFKSSNRFIFWIFFRRIVS